MIFLRYESFRGYLRAYPVTSVLIALNLIYFIVVAMTGNTNDAGHVIDYGAFISYPAGDPLGLQEPWRYVTSIFMHSGIQHLLFNMFSLLVFAPPLERLLKSLKYALFYLLCGILGNLLSSLISSYIQNEPHLAVGASGAIYGVYGAFLFISLFRKAWLDEASRKTVYTILGFGVVYSILIPSIDLWGHVGGGLAGFVLYGLLDRAMTKRRRMN
ncbi:rhomboid family intramembrane serine protease [Paenibacillus glycanilyticus]|uniref:Rhomboid protease YdcA n=1 Tax=Paenibacillus glycanilyticus TaxID=126569 RepID=A0ABQ6GF04_9BACL|nr:rhomboid family intramembrane serine protease [Paenibacillus glycanilyticus]GLX69252.1 putative rhomboid protease YdcA [Paenibacillus glycanilyticus]